MAAVEVAVAVACVTDLPELSMSSTARRPHACNARNARNARNAHTPVEASR